MDAVRKTVTKGLSQFKLTQDLLNNLSQFSITPTAKLVLLYLSSCYNPKKADMFPKQKTIAVKMGISERSVVRAVQELIKAGLLIVECKYTNRYKFTSQIVSKPLECDFYFCPDNLSDDIGQNVIEEDDKLSYHDIEPMNEPKIEPVEDYKILKQYARQHNAKNIKAYIEALRNNGAAQRIIEEMKEKQKAEKAAKASIQKTQKLVKDYSQWVGVSPKENEAIKEVLKKYRNQT